MDNISMEPTKKFTRTLTTLSLEKTYMDFKQSCVPKISC